MTTSGPRLVVLLSGSGTTLVNLAGVIRSGGLRASIVGVLASRPDRLGVDRARELGLPLAVLDHRLAPSPEAYSRDVVEQIRKWEPDIICLAGWLRLLHLPREWDGRCLNIHPALLPAFGGKGMYGHHVHQAVLDAGCKVSGCTVHVVDEQFDHGPIVVQRTCPVLEGDTAASLASRVFEEEKIAYPQAIRMVAARLQ